MAKKNLKQAALEYHAREPFGKLSISISKPTETQEDLSLAYTPGVAEPVLAIAEDPDLANKYTAKGNLVAVITNGSAVLGLGNVGPLASKPVMEGKAVLFKKFADIDVFDIEVDADNPQDFINTVVRIAPTFGGINLEDIKAPECFEIEQALKEQLHIPVFHDDQHGTAIIVAAGLLNALELQGKSIENAKIVCLGAGAAGIASMRLLVVLGAKKENIFLVDSQGVITTDRTDLNPYKFAFARDTHKKSLAEAVAGADVFIGVAKGNLFSEDMLSSMAPKPIVFALSNPTPEIDPDLAKSIRSDLIIATGRSDFPNQINNVLCFPYLFKGALQANAKCINDDMLIAAVHSIKELAHEDILDSVKKAYKIPGKVSFGEEYFIPKALDPRLRDCVTEAVMNAALNSDN
ncbi:MAG: malate dehydrogenase [Legionellales bacterium]|nr:malate dehydrogenase [Legionellales bacterium]